MVITAEYILEQMPGMAWLTDAHFNIRYANPAWYEYIGQSKDFDNFEAWQELYHPDDKEKYLANCQKLLQDQKDYEVEYRIRKHDGSYGWVRSNTKALKDEQGVFQGFIGTTIDISERKNAELEKNILLEKLINSNAELERFAYVCSHDLKEPLRIIKNYTDLLIDKLEEGDTINIKQYRKSINRGVSRANSLVNSILEYSKLNDDQNDKFELVDLKCLIKDSLDLLLTSEDNSDIDITINTEKLHDAHCHKIQIQQVLQNLISNAIKFKKEGVTPSIQIEGVSNGNEHFISVKDNGFGIDKENHENIFKAFNRLNRKDDYPGSGLGLAICKKIIDKHNGKIWVDSELGKGSKFSFTLVEKSQ